MSTIQGMRTFGVQSKGVQQLVVDTLDDLAPGGVLAAPSARPGVGVALFDALRHRAHRSPILLAPSLVVGFATKATVGQIRHG